MRTCGIIAEYNPLHNGHLYQMAEIRRRLGRDTALVVALSGDWTQRGEPAIQDKWERARRAVAHGADLVLLLPVACSLASAEGFAAGGVALLEACGVVQHLAFGAETEDESDLQALADLLAQETPVFRQDLQAGIKAGLGFAGARQQAVEKALGLKRAALLSQPNAILAVSYLIQLKRRQSSLIPLLIPRRGPGEHSSEGAGDFCSASEIRRRLLAEGLEDWLSLASFLPADGLASLMAGALNGHLLSFADVFPLVYAELRALDAEGLTERGLNPDLARRLKTLAQADWSQNDALPFIAQAATRAFPASRVRRDLSRLVLGLAPETAEPAALRVLAYSRDGRHLLQLMRRRARLPVFLRSSDILESRDEEKRLLEEDLRAADLCAFLRGARTRIDFAEQAREIRQLR